MIKYTAITVHYGGFRMKREHTNNDVEKLIHTLRTLLLNASYAYYVGNKSLVSDSEYDRLLEVLAKLEFMYPEYMTETSPTDIISPPGAKLFKKMPHTISMLSIKKTTKPEQVIKFDSSIKHTLNLSEDITYTCELKFDGIAVNLVYMDKTLVRAATRGDGLIGEDITNNIMVIKSVPLNLVGENIPKFLEVRGEVYMPRQAFELLNKTEQFSTPRNAASGSVRHKNPQVTKERGLEFVCYGVGHVDGCVLSDSHYENLQLLKDWGLPTSKYTKQVVGIDACISIYDEVLQHRNSIPFDIDGVVYKVDSHLLQDRLGETRLYPRYYLAHKFPPLEGTTRIIGFEYTVGKTGRCTPVGLLAPIKLGGRTISKVNLYNKKYMDKNNIQINDLVTIRLAGDAVPVVVSRGGVPTTVNRLQQLLQRANLLTEGTTYDLTERLNDVDD